MLGYSFVILEKEVTNLSPRKNHFAVYKLALDARLKIPFQNFVEQVLRFYNINHNQLVSDAWHNVLTFIAVGELCGLALSLPAFTKIHYVSQIRKTVDDDWFSVCNRTGFLTTWDWPSKMRD